MPSASYKIPNRIGFINRETYLEFKEKYPETDITYKDFVTILKSSNKAIRGVILENPLGFKMPYNLGYLAVDKFKPSKLHPPIDWVTSRKLGRKIPFLNLHTFGYCFSVKLYPNPRIKPLQIYKMATHRILKRMMAKNIKAGKEYLQIDRGYYSNRFRIGDHLNQF